MEVGVGDPCGIAILIPITRKRGASEVRERALLDTHARTQTVRMDSKRGKEHVAGDAQPVGNAKTGRHFRLARSSGTIGNRYRE